MLSARVGAMGFAAGFVVGFRFHAHMPTLGAFLARGSGIALAEVEPEANTLASRGAARACTHPMESRRKTRLR